ncbi:hypothetical protein [Candidatus Leptofilum sp.]|uniref:hypothetical protein n=1 Tax=Candidatus Leptofilum sp. TaxID=3241576 RepID=UPI003B593757
MSPLTTRLDKNIPETDLWQRIFGTERFLTWSFWLSLILFVGTIVLSIFDSRLVTGAPVWVKPMKFAISITLYTGTLAWLLSYVEGHPRLVRWIGGLTALGFLVEIIGIFVQAARGVPSHFNVGTPFDAVIFSLMGTFVLVIWVMNIATAVLLMRQKMDNRPFAWALRLGLLITAVGAILGFLMTTPTADQLAAMETGEMLSIVGAHSVGVEDGGAGLPFVGWSTEGGDIRPAHFVGLHALQLIPLLGIFVNRRFRTRLSEGRRTALVAIGGVGYLGVVLLLLWQALRAQPLIAPDGLTLAVLAGLVAVVSVAGTAVARQVGPAVSADAISGI